MQVVKLVKEDRNKAPQDKRSIGIISLWHEAQAKLIAPKFAAVEAALQKNLAGKGIAKWTAPKGGYFVSVEVLDGCAADIVKMADAAGVKLTPAGATHPYGKDPNDSFIRLAPTMPGVKDIETAMEVFCACVELVCARKLQAKG